MFPLKVGGVIPLSHLFSIRQMKSPPILGGPVDTPGLIVIESLAYLAGGNGMPRIASGVVCTLFFAAVSMAQTAVTATMVGTVTDTAGGLVVGRQSLGG